jgi:hypothetical protein
LKLVKVALRSDRPITKGQCSADFREQTEPFMLECARHLEDDPSTGTEYCKLASQIFGLPDSM